MNFKLEKKGPWFVLFFILSASVVFAQVGISDELLNFYSHDVSALTLSNDSIILYDNDRTTLYYLYHNPTNATFNVTTSLTCVSKNCPDDKQILFDYMKSDETGAHVKKAAAIFVATNDSPIGKYSYDLIISDMLSNYSQKAALSITVISEHFWTLFWHNLLSLFGI